jgi:hypothetical protein
MSAVNCRPSSPALDPPSSTPYAPSRSRSSGSLVTANAGVSGPSTPCRTEHPTTCKLPTADFFLGYGENNFLILQSGRLNCNVFFFYLLHHMFHLCILCLFDYILSISHFVEDWVRIGQPAKKKVQTECKALSFDDQCSVLEKVRRIPSVFSPLMNY